MVLLCFFLRFYTARAVGSYLYGSHARTSRWHRIQMQGCMCSSFSSLCLRHYLLLPRSSSSPHAFFFHVSCYGQALFLRCHFVVSIVQPGHFLFMPASVGCSSHIFFCGDYAPRTSAHTSYHFHNFYSYNVCRGLPAFCACVHAGHVLFLAILFHIAFLDAASEHRNYCHLAGQNTSQASSYHTSA